MAGHDAAGTASAPRESISFDKDWRFFLGDNATAKESAFDDSSWRTLDVPHDWSIEGPLSRPPAGDGNNGFFIHGIGWYRKSFTPPAAAAGKKVVIEFDGVYMNSEVWINGHLLGRRPYGFIGFRYDLTQFLKNDGSPNVIAVRVDDSAEPSTRWYSGCRTRRRRLKSNQPRRRHGRRGSRRPGLQGTLGFLQTDRRRHRRQAGRDQAQYRGINYNLFALASQLHPHLAVLDGYEGMEGEGPGKHL